MLCDDVFRLVEQQVQAVVPVELVHSFVLRSSLDGAINPDCAKAYETWFTSPNQPRTPVTKQVIIDGLVHPNSIYWLTIGGTCSKVQNAGFKKL